MREYLFDSNKLGNSPRYILFNILIDDKPYLGQVNTTRINLDAPFGPAKFLKVDSYQTVGRFLSGAMPTEIEDVPPSKIKIIDIIDGYSEKNPTTLSMIIDVSDQITKVDTSFAIYVIKENLQLLLDSLHEHLEEYGVEHPKSDYKTLLAYIKEQNAVIDNLGEIGRNEIERRENMRQDVEMLKEGLRKWMFGLIYRGDLN